MRGDSRTPGTVEHADIVRLPELGAGRALLLGSPDGDAVTDNLRGLDFGERFGGVQQPVLVAQCALRGERGDAVKLVRLPVGERPSCEGEDGGVDDDETAQTGIVSLPWTFSRVALASRMARQTVRSDTLRVSAMSMGRSPACSYRLSACFF